MKHSYIVNEIKIRGELKHEAPTEQGLWFLSCGENDGIFEPVAILEMEGSLVVEDLSLGRTPLDDFHNGLTDPAWLRQ